MKQRFVINTVLKAVVIGSAGLLAACNSSSDSAVATTSVSGYIVAAPVNGAEVNVVDTSGNVVAGPVDTNAAGMYTLNIPNSSLAQDLILKSSGGSFKDEATGTANGLAGEMLAYVLADSLSSGSSVSATPGSTIVAQLVMNHNKTMTQAQEAFANAFGYTPDITITPADATGPAVDATEASKLAGYRAGAFSQLAMDLNLSVKNINEPEMIAHQFALFAALAQDLSDGVLDGDDVVDAVDPLNAIDIGTTGFALKVNIQNSFVNAMANFFDNGNNLTLLEANQIGNLPFAKVALTDNGYQIEYVPVDMAKDGKTRFKLRISDANGAATGKTPMVMPMMHMEGDMSHSAPKLACAPDVDVDGDYDCTVYYLMASQMMDGSSMGYWDLKVDVDGNMIDTTNDVAHLYPTVMMAMPGMLQVRMYGVADTIMGMSRPYFIFKDELVGSIGGAMDGYDFSVFIATKKDMMTFPAIVDGLVVSDTLTVNMVNTEVTVSANDDPWSAPLSTVNGVWSITNLQLNNGVENQIRVKLTVNTEVKTTDGADAVVDTNDYQTFKVTPGM